MGKHGPRYGWGCHRGRVEGLLDQLCYVMFKGYVDGDGKVDADTVSDLLDKLAATLDHWKTKDNQHPFRHTINGGD